MKRIWISFICALATIYAAAYDFTEKDEYCNDFYFNIITEDAVMNIYTVEITHGELSSEVYTGTVIIPDSVEHNSKYYHVIRIGEEAFMSSTVMGIEIPKSVTEIQTYPHGAFDFCAKLTYISVASENPIYDSRDQSNGIIETATNTLLVGSLNTVIPSSVTKIGNCAFMGRRSNSYSSDIPEKQTPIRRILPMDCVGAPYPDYYAASLTTIDIPDNVISIGTEAFSCCSLLTSVKIGSGLSTIGDMAFSQCPALDTIEVDAANTHFCIVDSVLYSYDTTRIVYYPAAKTGNYKIRDSVTHIASGAFDDSKVSFLTIPETVTNIGSSAFNDCSVLDTVLCKALVPPTFDDGAGAFYSLPVTAILCVPYGAMDAYKAIFGYSSAFSEITGFSKVDNITETTVYLKWRPDTAVVRYEIDILKGAVVVKHYDVDGSGHLIVPSPMPPICRMKKDTTTSSADYFVIKVSDLEAGTDYNYTIQGTNASHQSIYHEAGDFRTKSIPLDCDPLNAEEPRRARKVLQDGQMLIIRDERTYTVMGVEMK